MVGSGRKSEEGEGELGADVEGFKTGGGGPEGVRAIFQSSSADGVAFWGRDVGPDPPDGAGHEQISAQGCATDHREAADAATVGGGLVISSDGGGNSLNQTSKRSGSMSRGDIIRLRNILLRGRLWTSVNGLFGGQECGCLGSGGTRKAWSWRG